MHGEALRVVAIAVLVAAIWAAVASAGFDAARRIDRRYRETRFVVERNACPLVVHRDQIWPECPIGQPSYDGT